MLAPLTKGKEIDLLIPLLLVISQCHVQHQLYSYSTWGLHLSRTWMVNSTEAVCLILRTLRIHSMASQRGRTCGLRETRIPDYVCTLAAIKCSVFASGVC